ncbi:MBL fold metallo-hydrolase [Nocardia sp. NPDC055049]
MFEMPGPGQPIRVRGRARLLLAPNASEWTFEGTNTWLLSEPGDPMCVVVDPGPADLAHIQSILATIGGDRVCEIWLTHAHEDHSDGAELLAEMTGAVIRSADPPQGGTALADGDQHTVGNLDLQVIATPGHSADSLSFFVPADTLLLTGDTLLGGGTPIVDPDGMYDMLRSLDRLAQIASESAGCLALPGHGPVIDDVPAAVAHRLRNRHRRIAQVAHYMRTTQASAESIVGELYPHLTDPELREGARLSVTAAMNYVLQHPDLVLDGASYPATR